MRNGENGIIIEEPVNPENIAKAIIKAVENKNIITHNAAEEQKINRSRFSSSEKCDGNPV